MSARIKYSNKFGSHKKIKTREYILSYAIARSIRHSGNGVNASERERLEEKYSRIISHRPELRRLVTYVPNKTVPIYNWFKYKEGFSREIVHLILKEWEIPKNGIVFDPFAGSGTTLLACKELGCRAIGLDILPIAGYVTKCKLIDYSKVEGLRSVVNEILKIKVKKPQGTFPDIPIIDKAFSSQTKDDIQYYKEAILRYSEPYQNFLMLGLLGILEEVSYTSKDGQFLRLVDKKIPPVKEALTKKLISMLADIEETKLAFEGGAKEINPEMYFGDARNFELPAQFAKKIDAIVTSPPYLNRYDYSRTYALELCALFVNSSDDLKNIRHSLLRSHIESRDHTDRSVHLEALSEILQNLKTHNLNNERIPVMVQGYFEDMNQVIRNLSRQIKKGGLVAMIVANARFEGEMVPVDLMLSELAEKNGFNVISVWITRFKGNSSQQMAKFGREPVRESIVFWRRN